MNPSYLWVKIRSWHLSSTVLPYRALGIPTLCGRIAPDAMAREIDPPAGEKSCETCFRVREGLFYERPEG